MPKRPPRRQLKRKSKIREPYDRVLIVTEGEKTEPLYFGELVSHYRLSTADIKGVGASPETVVEIANDLRKQERKKGEKYDRVYCIFDRDRHPSFAGASSRARQLGLRLARSWPCFEYWILLHFEFVRKPFTGTGMRSDCDNCIRALRKHIGGYMKATPGIFLLLKNKLEVAKSNARMAKMDAISTGTDDPSTEVHALVNYLQTSRIHKLQWAITYLATRYSATPINKGKELKWRKTSLLGSKHRPYQTLMPITAHGGRRFICV